MDKWQMRKSFEEFCEADEELREWQKANQRLESWFWYVLLLASAIVGCSIPFII
jgi:hypothetical protein